MYNKHFYERIFIQSKHKYVILGKEASKLNTQHSCYKLS